MKPGLALIVAMERSGGIGKGGDLPWRISEDLQHFKRLTTGHAILMGRCTHESIGRALPRRRNIVVTSRPGASFEGCEVAGSLQHALALASESDPCPFVIGGARLYKEALPLATTIHLTEIDRDVPCDVFFPPLEPGAWHEVERTEAAEPGVSFVTLERADG